jgi:Na+-translocating ferredoxin:NAD+ oxidoreductase RnfD subunit
LDIAAIIEAARAARADALHPGWGFLSEWPALAEACAAAGIVLLALRRPCWRCSAIMLSVLFWRATLSDQTESSIQSDSDALAFFTEGDSRFRRAQVSAPQTIAL